MNWLTKLPDSRKEPHGLEWRLMKRLPMLLLGGTLIPALFAIASRFFPPDDSRAAVVAHLKLVDIVATALVAVSYTHLTLPTTILV